MDALHLLDGLIIDYPRKELQISRIAGIRQNTRHHRRQNGALGRVQDAAVGLDRTEVTI